MKKFFSFLFVSLLTLAAPARVVVFDASEDYGVITENASPFIIAKDGVTLSFSNGLVFSSHWRLYKNQTLTICAEDGNITRIEFYCTASGDAQYGPGCLTCNTGDYSYEERVGLWIGCSQCVTFTAATNQVRFTKIVVTVEDSGLRAPVIKPASGTYYDPIEVTITCSTNGAKIYYTTDGSTPTTSSTQYTAPFTLNAATTVKAISEKDGETSDVVSAEYNFATATPVANIAAYSA
ncbi:MAG: chitobiase/beta-hexosaminidase C-terminal domain-containing protein, partial [Muribaculaceae bacterium]|nr:chitobiase/beta-hexosaminidase C-terminal domain-containing protein [Muribaculaceae bacterium]